MRSPKVFQAYLFLFSQEQLISQQELHQLMSVSDNKGPSSNHFLGLFLTFLMQLPSHNLPPCTELMLVLYSLSLSRN